MVAPVQQLLRNCSNRTCSWMERSRSSASSIRAFPGNATSRSIKSVVRIVPSRVCTYFDGELEVASTSEEHERVKKWLGDLMAVYFDEAGIEIIPRGQATMWLELRSAGAEPGESWCLETPKKYPDLVLEIALSSGGVKKLELYRRFEIPEVWIWRRQRLEIYSLGPSDQYDQSMSSRLLPNLNVPLRQECVAICSWREARRRFRAGLSQRSHER